MRVNAPGSPDCMGGGSTRAGADGGLATGDWKNCVNSPGGGDEGGEAGGLRGDCGDVGGVAGAWNIRVNSPAGA